MLKTKQNEFYQNPIDPIFDYKTEMINPNSNLSSPLKQSTIIDGHLLPSVNRKDINSNDHRITALEELNISENIN